MVAASPFFILFSARPQNESRTTDLKKICSLERNDLTPNQQSSQTAVKQHHSHTCSGSEDKTVRVWDINSGNLKNIYGGHLGKVYGLCFIGSGTILFSASKVCWFINQSSKAVN